jgi:cytochrome c oxidase subunit 2
MQAFGEQLNAVDLAAVITYERNAFGNDTGDMVQPSDVAAVK